MRARITATVFATTFGLMLALSAPASAASDDPGNNRKVHTASVMRAQAAELRDKANHLRDGEEVKRPNVAAAKKLDRKADALQRQANKIDPQQWPPN